MRSILFRMAGACAICSLVAIAGAGPSALAQTPQYPESSADKSKAPAVSDAERQAAQKINTSPDVTTKLQAATEFVKKYPKSTMRPQVASYMAGEIAKVQDAAQQITLAEGYIAAFNAPADADLINPVLVDAYMKASRTDDAFRLAATMVEKNPGDVTTFTEMALIGADQAKRNNPKYVQQTLQYAAKAIELIEADRRPESITVENWGRYKTVWLPQLYQSQGTILYLTGNKAEAKVKLDKAASLNSADPFLFYILGIMIDEDYRQLAQQVKSMLPGKEQTEALNKAHAKMDQVIEMFAHSLGLAAGKPQYQQFYDKLIVDLTTYYKYRHNGSTDGMQQLIDKYKQAPSQ